MGKIAEVFRSMQGEGIYAGEMQVFVRFFGCNLRCVFCDTRLTTFRGLGAEELFYEIRAYADDIHTVSFTGGEPLMQKEFLQAVMRMTKELGMRNYLETNGTLPEALKDVIDFVDVVAMDMKLPSSTGVGVFWSQHARFLEIASQKEVFVKAVVCRSTTVEDIHKAVALIAGTAPHCTLVLQPNSDEHDEALDTQLERFKGLCEKEGLTVRIIPQMHKLLGVR